MLLISMEISCTKHKKCTGFGRALSRRIFTVVRSQLRSTVESSSLFQASCSYLFPVTSIDLIVQRLYYIGTRPTRLIKTLRNENVDPVAFPFLSSRVGLVLPGVAHKSKKGVPFTDEVHPSRAILIHNSPSRAT